MCPLVSAHNRYLPKMNSVSTNLPIRQMFVLKSNANQQDAYYIRRFWFAVLLWRYIYVGSIDICCSKRKE